MALDCHDTAFEDTAPRTGDLLIDLVRVYSPSCHEARAVQVLVAWMAARGFDVWIDAAGNACGMRGPRDARHTLLLLGHIDTVAGHIPVAVRDGWLHGRGSVDAKGSLCAFAEAAALAALPPDWRVIVVGAVEEEAPTSRGARFVRAQFDPDLCIIGEPSGVDRVTLGYKGHALLEYSLARPVRHTSRPEPTAAELGVAFWNRVQAWAAQQNAEVTRHFEQVMPHLLAFNTQSDGFQTALAITLSFRLPPPIAPGDVLAAAQQFRDADGDLRLVDGAVSAYQGAKNNALVRGMLAAIRAQGGDPGFVLKGGTSDMNVVGETWSCPIIAYGPGDSALDHTPEERLNLDEYAQAVRTLTHLIEHLSL